MYVLATWQPSFDYVRLPSMSSAPIMTTAPATSTEERVVPQLLYFEVLDGCGPRYEGACVNVRSGPGVTYPSVSRLRTGVVLRVAETVTVEGHDWYKILFAHGLLYPERVTGEWYVSADVVHPFFNDGDHELEKGEVVSTTKNILVDRSEQMLYAYDGDILYMETPISTGLELTPTPRGKFEVFKMTPSRFMQGPIPGVSDQVYDLPGVPWNLYFTNGGAVVHGAYWHDKFGEPWSHGCVNLPLQEAKKLYLWAEIGTVVTIRE